MSSVSHFLRHKKEFLSWYIKNSRPLPWRENIQPYNIWISEVMSQQSTLAMMLPYYQKWTSRWPTLEALSKASMDEVLNAWQGLGYYSRARSIHQCAQELSSFILKNGRWPEGFEEWLKFPGIGPYTAKAIAAIAFEKDCLPLDGNVTRVLSRFLGIKNPLNNKADLKKISQSLDEISDNIPKHHGDFAQAFMELGALLCRPGSLADCSKCPLRPSCQAFKKDKVALWPQKKKRKENKKILGLAIIYRRGLNKILFRNIPQGRHLAGQWELPFSYDQPAVKAWLKKLPKHFEVIGPKKHQITHHAYTLYGLEAGQWPKVEKIPPHHRFIEESDLGRITITQASRKLLNWI